MAGLMIFIVYLIVGAALGLLNHKMFEQVIEETMVKVPFNVRGLYVASSLMLIIVLAPIIQLLDIVTMLKPKK